MSPSSTKTDSLLIFSLKNAPMISGSETLCLTKTCLMKTCSNSMIQNGCSNLTNPYSKTPSIATLISPMDPQSKPSQLDEHHEPRQPQQPARGQCRSIIPIQQPDRSHTHAPSQTGSSGFYSHIQFFVSCPVALFAPIFAYPPNACPMFQHVSACSQIVLVFIQLPTDPVQPGISPDLPAPSPTSSPKAAMLAL